MRRYVLLVLTGLAVLCGGPARADLGTAEHLFQRGDYQAALAEVAEREDAEALAFSAQTLLAEAMCGPGDPPEALLHRALDKADAALARDPRHDGARLQRAIALSLIIRPMSLREARKTGWGEEARDIARDILAGDPDNTYAHGFLAVWNVEVVRRGGTIGAMIMGASVSDGRRHYSAAAGLAPDDASLHWQWARALAALDAREYREEILAALDAALAASVDSVLEGVMQARAALLKEELLRDTGRAGTLASRML